jgi:hypothetical protein
VMKKQILANGLNLRVDSLVFLQGVEELVVVSLELVFLEENDSSGFWDLDSLSVKAFGFTDELHDFQIEVHVELLIFLVSDNQGGL